MKPKLKLTLAQKLDEIAECASAVAEATSANGDVKGTLSALSAQLNALLAVARLSPEQIGYEGMTLQQKIEFVKRDEDGTVWRGLLDSVIAEGRIHGRGHLTDGPSEATDSKPH